MTDTNSAWGDNNNSHASSNKPTRKRSIVAGISALVLVAGGYLGVQAMDSSASASSNNPPGAMAGMGMGGGTRGTLSSISGSTLTVAATDFESSSTSNVNVATSASTVFLKASTGSVSDLKVGDNVSVMGTNVVDSGSTAISMGGGGAPPNASGQTGAPSGNAPSGSNANQPSMTGGGSGTITAISGDTVTIQTTSGSTTTVTIDSSSTVSVLKTVQLSDVSVGDALQVNGTTSNGTVTATQVIDGLSMGGPNGATN